MNTDDLKVVREYESLLDRLGKGAIADLDAALNISYRAMETQLLDRLQVLQQSGGDILGAQRAAVLVNDLAAVMQLVNPENAGEYERALERVLSEAGVEGDRLAAELLQAVRPESAMRPFAGIPLDVVAQRSKESVQRLRNHSEEFRQRASAVVSQSLIQGWGSTRTAGILRRELGITKGKAEAIARTEIMSAFNWGAMVRYVNAGIEFVQWVITPAESLCRVCAARNMRVYRIRDAIVPAHPFCRCMVIPWGMQWQGLGLTDDEFARDYRQQVMVELVADGKVPDYGATPFERAAGLERAPEAVWVP
ncbi:phage minor head protein [Thermoleptolyngbya sp. M55_K2018_002]|uniref:phage minor head protein n=1 Tax=Thermoleptolyngbya sp. M55_K2018_002 TaxID=2747808 RepID=UPI0019E49A03|nr:phage minor head protein [Thermoleptolyngbya sp. M55_K2018_002]HIK42169.1 hypothetical protein [Thermoleptolyngbya sp. M55_K2018_002]